MDQALHSTHRYNTLLHIIYLALWVDSPNLATTSRNSPTAAILRMTPLGFMAEAQYA